MRTSSVFVVPLFPDPRYSLVGLMIAFRADLVVRDPKGIHGGEILLQFNFE
jgi:hypothetical protein